jgi:hypothetical protein
MRASIARHIAFLAIVLVAALVVCTKPAPALASRASQGQFIELLESAKRAEALYFGRKGKDAEIDQQGRLMDAIDCYTDLYQLYRWPQALARIIELRREPIPVLDHTANANLGRIKVDVSRMELQNPAYGSYTMYLCHIEDRSPLWMHAKSPTLSLRLMDRTSLSPETISPSHPLYPHLRRIAGTFSVPSEVGPARVVTFKAVFSRPMIPESDIDSFQVDGYGPEPIILPFLENLVSRENSASSPK